MPTGLQMEGLGELQIPDDYSEEDVITSLIHARLKEGVYQPNLPEMVRVNNLLNRIKKEGKEPPVLVKEDIEEPDTDGWGLLGDFGRGVVTTFGRGLRGGEVLLEQLGLDPTGDDEGWFRRAGQSLIDNFQSQKTDPSIASELASGFGSFAAFASLGLPVAVGGMVFGLPVALAKALGLGIAAAFGSGVHVDEAIERARAAGVPEDQLKKITLQALPLGPMEVIPPFSILKGARPFIKSFGRGRNIHKHGAVEALEQETRNLSKKSPLSRTDWFKKFNIPERPIREFALKTAGGFGLEGSQEALAAIAQNAIERYNYNPDKKLVDGDTIKEGLYGGTIGGTLAGIITAFGLRKSRFYRKKLDEFIESDEYKGIRNNLASAIEEREKAVEAGFQDGIEQAEQKIKNANELIEVGINNNIYGAPEMIDWLKTRKDEEGNFIYSEDYIDELSKNPLDLKELYQRHVMLPSTKWEADARDTLATLVNPQTKRNYTHAEIDEIYKRHGRVRMAAEASLLERDQNLVNEKKLTSENRDKRTQWRLNNQASPSLIGQFDNIFKESNSATEQAESFINLSIPRNKRKNIEKDLFAPYDQKVDEHIVGEFLSKGSGPINLLETPDQIYDGAPASELLVAARLDKLKRENPPIPVEPTVSPAEPDIAPAESDVAPAEPDVAPAEPDVETTVAPPPTDVETTVAPPPQPPTFNSDFFANKVASDLAKEFGMETEESVANIATEAGIEFTGPVKNGSKTATVSDIKKIKNWQQEQESPIKKQPPVVEEEIVEEDVIEEEGTTNAPPTPPVTTTPKPQPTPIIPPVVDNTKKIAELKNEINEKKTAIVNLENSRENKQEIIDNLFHGLQVGYRDEITPQQQDGIAKLDKEIAAIDKKIADLENEIKTIENEIRELGGEVDPDVTETNGTELRQIFANESDLEVTEQVDGTVSRITPQQEQKIKEAVIKMVGEVTEGDPESSRKPTSIIVGTLDKLIDAQNRDKVDSVQWLNERAEKEEALAEGRVHIPVLLGLTRTVGYPRTRVERIDIRSERALSSNTPHGLDIFRRVMETGAHEAFHAAKVLVLTPEQMNILNKHVTVTVGRQNGLDHFIESYEKDYRELFEQGHGHFDSMGIETEEQFENWLEQEIQEEVQAEVFAKWYNGETIAGLQLPSVRSSWQKLKDFFQKFANWAKGQGWLKNKIDPYSTAEQQATQEIFDLYENLANGNLAQQVGRKPLDASAQYAALNIPQNYEKIAESGGGWIDKIIKSIKPNPNGGTPSFEGTMEDLSTFAKIFAHPESIARKNKLFRRFYQGIQKRVNIRNSNKFEALATAADFEKMNRRQQGTLNQLVALADEAEVEPIFDLDKGTVSITMNNSILNDVVSDAKYGSMTRFLSDIGLNPNEITITDTRDADNKPTKTFSYSADKDVVGVFSQIRSAIILNGRNQIVGLLHNVLNSGFFKGKVGGIGTKRRDGFPMDYNSVIKDIDQFFENNDFITKEQITGKNGRVFTEYKLDLEKMKDATEEEISANFFAISPDLLNKPTELNLLVDLFSNIKNFEVPGYFPRYRPGDHAVVVFKVITDENGNVERNKDGSPRYQRVRMETVETTFVDEAIRSGDVFGNVGARRLKRKQQERKRELEEIYSGDEFLVEDRVLTLDNLRSKSQKNELIREAMGIFEEVSMMYEGGAGKSPTQTQGHAQGLVDIMKTRLLAGRAETMLRGREKVPGHINRHNNDGKYLARSFLRAIDSGANQSSSLFMEPELVDSLSAMKEKGNLMQKYHQTAEKLYQYINDPNNEAGFLRAFAFHSFLGMNISSALVNMTQTVQATFPVLAASTGMGRSTMQVTKAYKDAMKLYGHMITRQSAGRPRLGEYGFSFFTTKPRPDGTFVKELNYEMKPDWMDKNEFEWLSRLFETGEIQPIQNIDLGAGKIQEHLPPGAARTVANASGYAFGLIENMNRITAALAFRRSALQSKDNKKINDNMRVFIKETRFGDEYNDAMSNEEFADLFGRMGVEKTQFFMGAENRPQLFMGKPMSVISQFQSFLWQMVGMYSDVFLKSLGGRMGQLSPQERPIARRMAMKQLAAMSLSIMAFGGVMGLPFMDNWKELIRFITEQFGDEVGEDLEQEAREVLGEIMGYDATDAMLRGLPRLFGADVARRTSYGDVIPLRLLMGGDPIDFAGPAVSRFADMIQGVKHNLDQGRYLEAGVNILPVAIGNAYRSLFKEPQLGTFTQRGQQLLPPGSLSPAQRSLGAIGFTPGIVGQARQRRGVENYLTYRAKNGKETYTSRMAANLGGYIGALQDGRPTDASEYLQNYLQDYLHVVQHDIDNIGEPSRQYRINPQTALKRAFRMIPDPFMNIGPRVPKAVQHELLTGMYLKDSIPMGT